MKKIAIFFICNTKIKFKCTREQEQRKLVHIRKIFCDKFIKPAVVDYVLNHKDEIKTDTYLRYYLEQQLHFLGHNKSEADSYIEKVHKFYISVAPRFTPVMTPLV